jgi:hypothetical protein
MKRIGLRDGQPITFNVQQFDIWEDTPAVGNNYCYVVILLK